VTRVLAVCIPATDDSFGERVRSVVARHTVDLESPEGVALMQALLRERFPFATVWPHIDAEAASEHPTIQLHFFRDGLADGSAQHLQRVAELYDRCGPAAYRVAMGILGDEALAEHVVEAAFLELGRELAGGRSTAAVATWALEATTRRNAHAMRREALVPSSWVQPEPARHLRDAISRLRSAQRAALEMSMVEGRTAGAIAERMQCSAASVHQLLAEALSALRSTSSDPSG